MSGAPFTGQVPVATGAVPWHMISPSGAPPYVTAENPFIRLAA